MRTAFTLAAAAAALCLASVILADDFYYGTYGPIPVETDSSKVMVLFNDDVSLEEQQLTLDRVDRIVDFISDSQPVDGFAVCTLITGTEYRTFLDSLQAVEEIELVEPYLRLRGSSPLYIGRSFCAAFNSSVTRSDIDRINADYGVSIQREVQ